MTVGSSPVLSGVQKFTYLRAQLWGEAARAVAGFLLTDTNYLHSVEILKERFGEAQTIVNVHMQALIDLPLPKNTMKDLRAFHDSIEGHIGRLIALGTTLESYGAMSISAMLGKLPAEVQRNLAREQQRPRRTIESFKETLSREIRLLKQGVFTSGTRLQASDSPMMIAFSLHAGATKYRN